MQWVLGEILCYTWPRITAFNYTAILFDKFGYVVAIKAQSEFNTTLGIVVVVWVTFVRYILEEVTDARKDFKIT